MARLASVLVLLGLALLCGCESMMREFNATTEWESCRDPACALCGGTGIVYCTRCTPQGETQCERCHGTGMADEPLQVACEQCQGKGHVFTAKGVKVRCSVCNATGRREVYERKQCPDCGGRGWGPCPDCGGDKRIEHGRMVKVYQDGQRVPGQLVLRP